MVFNEYIPTAEDVFWAIRIIARVRDGGVLAFPTTRLMYQVDHVTKKLTLQNPFVLYDDADHDYATVVHRRVIAVFRQIGYRTSVKEKTNENP